MKVALFYNKENIGDVLIMKSNDEIGTSIKKIDDLVVIYKNDETKEEIATRLVERCNELGKMQFSEEEIKNARQ